MKILKALLYKGIITRQDITAIKEDMKGFYLKQLDFDNEKADYFANKTVTYLTETESIPSELLKSYIEIPKTVRDQLDRLSKETNIPIDQIAIEIINKYLWKIRAERLREKLTSAAREKGIVTEEDVFREIS